MRILIDLSDDDIRWLDRKAADEGKSRAAIMREAVTAFRATSSQDWLEKGFGLWAKHGFNEDGLAYQERLRREWDRDWDVPGGSRDDTR